MGMLSLALIEISENCVYTPPMDVSLGPVHFQNYYFFFLLYWLFAYLRRHHRDESHQSSFGAALWLSQRISEGYTDNLNTRRNQITVWHKVTSGPQLATPSSWLIWKYFHNLQQERSELCWCWLWSALQMPAAWSTSLRISRWGKCVNWCPWAAASCGRTPATTGCAVLVTVPAWKRAHVPSALTTTRTRANATSIWTWPARTPKPLVAMSVPVKGMAPFLPTLQTTTARATYYARPAEK